MGLLLLMAAVFCVLLAASNPFLPKDGSSVMGLDMDVNRRRLGLISNIKIDPKTTEHKQRMWQKPVGSWDSNTTMH